MTNREIVRDNDVAGGRWRFAGSGIFIDDMQRDAAANHEGAQAGYGSMGITDGEFADAMAFVFPTVNAATVEGSLLRATIHCSCGIKWMAAIDPDSLVSEPCACGRRWQLSIGIAEHDAEPHQESS